jgi:uncharacterized membrane protein (DUF106 family)
MLNANEFSISKPKATEILWSEGLTSAKINIGVAWEVVPYILWQFLLSFGGEYNLLSTLNRQAPGFSEKSVATYQITRRQIPWGNSVNLKYRQVISNLTVSVAILNSLYALAPTHLSVTKNGYWFVLENLKWIVLYIICEMCMSSL